MSSIGLNIGLKALLTSQTALDNVGHNISNASTPGYSRQHVGIAAERALLSRGLSLGSGVGANLIARTADALLHRRLIGQQSSLSQLDQRLSGMSQIEGLLGEPGAHGLSSLLQGFYSSLASLSGDPEDMVLRTGAVQSAQGLTSRFRELSGSLGQERKDVAGQITAQLGQANGLATRISKLNREIAMFESSGAPANDLRDQRDQALKDLAQYVDVNANEGPDGYVTVLTNGALLVGSTKSYALSATIGAEGDVAIHVAGNPHEVHVKGGSVGGLVQLSEGFVPDLLSKINGLAHALIQQVNQAHSTGIPADGAFHELTGAYVLQDVDGSGDARDDLLANAGLPFEVHTGALYLNVTDEEDGSFTTTRIDIDRANTTVQDLIDALEAIPHVDAALDGSGRLQIRASPGYGFDFSRRTNPAPDARGTLGGSVASLGSTGEEPFALANGDTLTLNGPAGALSLTLSSADFADITQASAAELASAINGDPATATSGMRAVAQDGRLFLQSLSEGASTSFTLTGGTALAALGWSASTTTTGQAHSVDVALSGTYTGASNQQYTLVPSGDGIIGTTPGLSLEVLDASGAHVTTLDVGAGYQPGTPLTLANGLEVRFGLGEVSATDGDRLTIDALADSDGSDALVALGMNALFTGTDASDIALAEGIELDPRLLAASLSGIASDNGALKDLLATRDQRLGALDDLSVGEAYGDLVGGVGFEIDATQSARDVEQSLFDSLQSRREQISGVNVDEELVDMIRFQQAYSAAARFITVINSTSDEILRLL